MKFLLGGSSSPLRSLIIVFLLFFAFPGEAGADPLQTASSGFLVLADPDSKDSAELAENIRRVFSFASLPYREISVQDAPALTKDLMKPWRAIVIAAEKGPQSLFKDDVLGYVREGGTLFFANRGWHAEWMPDLGITLATGTKKHAFALGGGFVCKEPVFRGISLEMSQGKFGADFVKARFSPEWRVQMAYKDPPGQPLLLTRDFGKGKIVFWNGTCLHLKEFRGFLLFSLLRVLPIAAMSVFNATLFQIDDSPPPGYGVREGPVYKDLGLTDFQFYKRVWYPKVLDALRDAGIKPTHFSCFTYSGKVEGPFFPQTDRDEFFQECLDTIKKRREEIALHGYNHQSLTLTSGPSKPWPSKDLMVRSLQVADQLWKKFRLLPTLLYVPPNNVIDKAGREALSQGFSSIRGVCRLYVGAAENYSGGDFESMMSGDEFGPDPQVSQLLNAPRLSSGMFLNEVQKLSLVNGFMAHGVVNHFIHPDDMYDPDRRGSSWEATFLGLQWLLRFIRTSFPYGRTMFTGEFLHHLKRYFADPARISWIADTKVRISAPNLGRRFFYLFAPTRGKSLKMTGAKIIADVEPEKVFLIELTDPAAEIELNLD